MNAKFYDRLMAAITYATASTAHRRDPKRLEEFLTLRDDLQEMYSEHADAARSDAAVDATPRFDV